MKATDILQTLFQDNFTLARQTELLRELNQFKLTGEFLVECVNYIYGLYPDARLVMPGRRQRPALDIVGTGGDNSGSFNISTTSAFVIAACHVPVIKHGNIGISSRSGSIDCLRALNVAIPENKAQAEKQFTQSGLTFLFAKNFYPCFGKIREARQALSQQGEKTIFNLLGPLLNPAQMPVQVIGVYHENLLQAMAKALQLLKRRAFVVTSGGLDEFSLCAANRVVKVSADQLNFFELSAKEVNLPPCTLKDIAGGSPQENAAITKAILQGKGDAARRNTVLLNAGAAIALYYDIEIREGIILAKDAMDSGTALAKLKQLGA